MKGQFCTFTMYLVFNTSKNQGSKSYKEPRYLIGRTYSPCRQWASKEYLEFFFFEKFLFNAMCTSFYHCNFSWFWDFRLRWSNLECPLNLNASDVRFLQLSVWLSRLHHQLLAKRIVAFPWNKLHFCQQLCIHILRLGALGSKKFQRKS